MMRIMKNMKTMVEYSLEDENLVLTENVLQFLLHVTDTMETAPIWRDSSK
jgi:hypothetical protein